MNHAVELVDVSVTFGSTAAARDVSFYVDFGEIVTLLGPNGAGKTTWVETLLGFRSPNAGQVRLLGLDPVTRHRDVVASVGALLQRGGVWFPMSPRQVLTLTATYYPAPRDVDDLLEELSLRECASTPWRRLSGGQQQRTLLALAIVGRPRVLVLDEPTAAVDPEGHLVVAEILRAERARGCALVVTTHDLVDAESLADRVVILDGGRTVAAGTVAELAGAPLIVVETDRALDPTELSRRLGVDVTVSGPREVRARVGDRAGATAAVQNYVAEVGAELLSLRTRASLEEIYLELVSSERPT